MTANIKQHTVLVLYQGCVFQEVSVALTELKHAFPLVVASSDGDPVLVQEGFHIAADISYRDIDLGHAAVILVPGGDCYDAFSNQDLANKIAEAAGDSVPVAGICNGALLLAKAGILGGRRCTHTCTPKYAPLPEFKELLEVATPLFSSSIYCDEDVVTDGKIITAKPWAFIDFGVTVAELTGAVSKETGRDRGAYLKGNRTRGKVIDAL